LRHLTPTIALFLAVLIAAGCDSDSSSSPTRTTDDPPVVTITAPEENDSWFVDTYDDTAGEWYIEVSFTSTVMDDEDGEVEASSIVWKAQADGHDQETLGTGENLTARLYSKQPFGTPYTITLEATDSAGNTTTASVSVIVNILS